MYLGPTVTTIALAKFGSGQKKKTDNIAILIVHNLFVLSQLRRKPRAEGKAWAATTTTLRLGRTAATGPSTARPEEQEQEQDQEGEGRET